MVGDLEAAVRAEPYRERRWELLILAQYRSGRQADALSSLRRVRDLLAEELGLDPGPALQDLERRLLLQDPRLLLDTRPPRTPRPLSAFLGRGSPPPSPTGPPRCCSTTANISSNRSPTWSCTFSRTAPACGS
ncbi:hypothetical protein Q0Z83_047480 [Actinoplanes sichuanensis]|nr:hypothetical protein Q0Z83_047480 [Actinoplanes sichuanensis]